MWCFGVISDIQYADHDDSLPLFPPLRTRYYRHTPKHLRTALTDFKTSEVEFVLQLGDIIDGKCKRHSREALRKILDIFAEAGIPVHHTLGNHDMYNFSHEQALKEIINNRVTRSSPPQAYYAFVSHGLRFINLDSYDVAVLGRAKEHPTYALAASYLTSNVNQDMNSPDGLEGLDRRFVQYNGAIGEAQIAWLSSELRAAEEAKQSVVVFGHCGVSPEGTYNQCLLWNYDQVLALLESSPCVKLVLNGHGHIYLHGVSATGKHYVTLRAVLETPPNEKSWMTVEVDVSEMKITAHDGSNVDEFVITL
ncbi:uncharacterized protein [Watersipora subatra]|uniref:uncharacterized protein n=1 Tax=Watersipora subatra TaxID=2589382 RepID=UPI00355C9743